MKCSYCGNELNEQDLTCPFCGKAVGQEEAAEGMAEGSNAAQISVPAGSYGEAGNVSGSTAPEAPKKKSAGKTAAIAIAAAAVIGIGAFAAVKLMEKDPKEVVIAAFENIYTEDQVNPMEELFGVSGFGEFTQETSQQVRTEIVLDSCSDEMVNQVAGGGIRTEVKYDMENQKGTLDLGILFNQMDLVTMNFYYGDETVMAAIPELSGKVFTLDVSDGLVERIENSPTLGPIMASSGMDMKALAEFYQEYMEWIKKKVEDGTASDPYGIREVWKRYQEGSQAQENFKAALTVEKAEKGIFLMDGKEVKCKGYQVHISKDSMIDFLDTSADFFLQDEQLKENFLENLRMSLRMIEITNGEASEALGGLSAEERLEENYDEVRKSVEEAIDELDSVLNDVEMLVHVDSKGRLASVVGTTVLDTEDESTEVTFTMSLQGGSYLTQNAQLEVELTQDDETVAVKVLKQGTYDGKNLTGDMDIELSGDVDGKEESYGLMLSGTYSSEDGDFNLEAEVRAEEEKVFALSAMGAVSELEKGSVLHMDLDEIRIDVPESEATMTYEDLYIIFSGEYDLRPLEDEIEEPEGEKMDVLAATESDWQRVAMEAYMGIMDIASQLQTVIQ